jgi:ABC-type antimicrobial peptide transport system permease subunit
MGALSLTAGMIGGLLERRRPFALLRASGMRIGELRRVVFLETTVTMVVTSAIGMGVGMLLAYVASRRGGGAWHWPDLEVYAYVGGGVLIALAFSIFALPLLGATIRSNAVRYE